MEAIRLTSAFFAAAALPSLAKGEQSWQQVESPLPAAMQQTLIMMILLGQISTYYKLQNKAPLSTASYVVGGLTPLAIGYGAENHYFGAEGISKQLSTALLLTYSVVSLAFIKIGKEKYAAASFSGIALYASLNDPALSKVAIFFGRIEPFLTEKEKHKWVLPGVKCLTYFEQYYEKRLFGDFVPTSLNREHLKRRPMGPPSEEKRLYTLLYSKQDEFLRDLFDADYDGKPEWFKRLFGKGTPQRFNCYRLFYGEPIGLNVDRARTDETQDPDGMPFSRLIWKPWVIEANRCFFQDYYTEANLIQWVQKDFSLSKLEARNLLIKHQVLTG